MQYYKKSMFLVKAMFFMVISLAIYMGFVNDKVLSIIEKQKQQQEFQQSLMQIMSDGNEIQNTNPVELNNNQPMENNTYAQQQYHQYEEYRENRPLDNTGNGYNNIPQQNEYRVPDLENDAPIKNPDIQQKQFEQSQNNKNPEMNLEQPPAAPLGEEIVPEQNSQQMIPVR